MSGLKDAREDFIWWDDPSAPSSFTGCDVDFKGPYMYRYHYSKENKTTEL